MKVLVVSAAFYPGISPRAFRTVELVKELSRQGHSVDLVSPFSDEAKEYFKSYIRTVIPLEKANYTFTGKSSLLYYAHRVLELLFEYKRLQLAFEIFNKVKKLRDYDLLISIAQPHAVHWGVSLACSSKKRIAKRWVADCGDPYALRDNEPTIPFYFHSLEKWFMRKADYIAVPTDKSYMGYYPEFYQKMKVIPQGFKFSDYDHLPSKKNNEIPTFFYGGTFMPGQRDPREFCDFLLEEKFDFKFYIYTGNDRLVKNYPSLSDNKIEVHSLIDRSSLLALISEKADFVVNFENSTSKQTPSKLIDYSILKKPILSIQTGNLDCKNVTKFLQGNYEGRYQIDDLDMFRIENVTKSFLNLVDDQR